MAAAISLRTWIWRAFAQTALVPLLLVETVLIAAYLWSNGSIRDAQVEHLRSDARGELQTAARMEAQVINHQLAGIGQLTELYRSAVGRALLSEQAPTKLNLALSNDGVRYSPKNEGGGALFYSNHTPVAQQDLAKAARLTDLDPFMRDIQSSNPLVASVYFNSWDSLNHIYPWFQTLEQYPHDMDIPSFNFYYLADAQHNPRRRAVWTDVYLDPAGHGWMMSVIAPVWRDDFLEGVVGLDITVGAILQQIERLQIPWNGYAMLVSASGNIMALPNHGEDDFGLAELTEHSYTEAISRELFKPEDFNLGKREETRALAETMQASTEGQQRLMLGGKVHLVAWSTIGQTGWRLLTVVDEADLFAHTDALADRYARVGYLLIGGLVLFYLLFFTAMWLRSRQLSQQLLQPVLGISRMLDDIGQGVWRPLCVSSQIHELERMAKHAQSMGERLEYTEGLRDTAQHRLELVLDNAIEGLWEYVPENDSIQLRGPFLKNFGMPGSWMDFPTLLKRVHPDDYPIMEHSKQRLVDGESDDYESQVRFADAQGHYHWLLARGRALVRREDGTLLSAAGTLVDIDRLKRAQTELEQANHEAQAANQAKSRFLSSVTHELRTPLNAILGFAQLLRLEHPASTEQKDHLDEILMASRHLDQLVGDILDWSRLQAERPLLKLKLLEVDRVLNECADLIRPQVEAHELRLLVELPEPGTQVVGESRRLRQVLLNLLSNAIKYNRPHGHIRLYTESGPGVLRLLVEDSGLGLSAEQREGLFEPFQRLGREKTAIQGTGIGLVLCRDLAELMSGRIGLRSEPGEGSCFWIELPVELPAQAAPPITRRVVLADSDDDEAARITTVIEPMAQVTRVSDFDALVAALQDGPASLVLLDAQLAGLSESDPTHLLRLQEIARSTPLVVLWAIGAPLSVTLGDCQGLLGKPIEDGELLRLVGALLLEEIEDA